MLPEASGPPQPLLQELIGANSSEAKLLRLEARLTGRASRQGALSTLGGNSAGALLGSGSSSNSEDAPPRAAMGSGAGGATAAAAAAGSNGTRKASPFRGAGHPSTSDSAQPRDAAGASGANHHQQQQPSKRRKTSKPLHRPLDGGSNSAGVAAGSTSTAGLLGPSGRSHPDQGPLPRSGSGAATSVQQQQQQQQQDQQQQQQVEQGEPPAVIVIDGGSNPPSPFGNQGPRAQPPMPAPARTPRSASKQPPKGQTPINRFFLPTTNSHDGHSRDSEPGSAGAGRQQQQQQQQQLGGAHAAATAPVAALFSQQADAAGGAAQQRGSVQQRQPEDAALKERLRQQQQEAGELLKRAEEFKKREAELAAQLEMERSSGTEAQRRLQEAEQELSRIRSEASERDSAVKTALASLARGLASKDGALARLQLAAGAARLGTLSVARSGPMGFAEVWEDGQAFQELTRRAQALQRQKEEVEAARKALKRRLPPPPRAAGAAAAAIAADASQGDASASGTAASTAGPGGGEGYLTSAEYVTRDEILKVRLAALKREEEALAREEERLALDRMRHIRLLKRVRDEDGSRFAGHHPLLHGRYVLMGLLGKGGFSEVHRAFDLSGLGTVAVKVHQLNSAWAEAKKASYVRHAVREYSIHKALRHPNIVNLLDIFEVDANTFATVLELCPGGDLDTHLREHTTLPEREARAIMAQVFAGLAYLNRGSAGGPNYPAGLGDGADGGGPPLPRVIHYDLKPANILFDELGCVKITDFGLSKVVEDGNTQGMELTSQGAGTYWYLPPECFETAATASALSAAGSSTGLVGSALAGLMGGGAGGASPIGGVGSAAAAAAGGASAASAAAARAPRISNKVDVWSAGVIFYQMLYGRRPFGEGLSQEQIFRERVVLNARQVEFPPKPAVSAEAKAFISRCLAYRQQDRWDVLTAAADPYLQLKR